MIYDENINKNKSSQDGSIPLKFWIDILNNSIAAIETTVWKGRKLADNTMDGWHQLDQERKSLLSEANKLSEKLNRLTRTAWVLTRIATSYRVWGTMSAFIPSHKTSDILNRKHKKNAQLFRDLSLTQGGAFLKIGQLLSARSDILPKAWVAELQVLQDSANIESFTAIQATLLESLGGKLDDHFSHFGPKPIAAASIGQVHKATLKNGQTVAVKVQRPNIESIITTDMALLQAFIGAIRPMLPETDLATITIELKRAILEEINYTQEAIWMKKAKTFLNPIEGVIVPEVISELSTKTVLVSEYVEGIKLTDKLNELKEQGNDELTSELLGRLLDMYIRQVLQAGFFQADPHPGNILVTPNNELVLLDFGCTQELSEEFREGYLKILTASISGNKEIVAEQLAILGFKTKSGKPDTLLAFSEVLLQSIQAAAKNLSGDKMKWNSPDEILQNSKALLNSLDADPVTKLPPEFIMLARVFTTLGGLFTHYKPNINAQRYILPHLFSAALEME